MMIAVDVFYSTSDVFYSGTDLFKSGAIIQGLRTPSCGQSSHMDPVLIRELSRVKGCSLGNPLCPLPSFIHIKWVDNS
ncbi:unnamed protein product [Caenorhabditis nigoni]